MKVLYEDNHLLVVIKPPGVPTQADSSNDEDMLTIAKQYIKDKYDKPGEVFLGLVHRLDRPVGGVMVFARTSKAAARLSEQIRKGTFQKTYICMCDGRPKGGAMEHYLLKDTYENKVVAVSQDTRGAKFARLKYEVIGYKDGVSTCQVDLITGRAHQIRVQFAASGFPLVNDMKYNKNAKPGRWIALYSKSIAFEHPTKKEPMLFSAPDIDLINIHT
ncbi:MAG: RNA pseudouridine synthase [Clostridia bacterium]|nr:RNA pseudouridine synthase [Clostridia bacterium]